MESGPVPAAGARGVNASTCHSHHLSIISVGAMLHRTGYNRVNVTLCRLGRATGAKLDPEMGTRIRGALSKLGEGTRKAREGTA